MSLFSMIQAMLAATNAAVASATTSSAAPASPAPAPTAGAPSSGSADERRQGMLPDAGPIGWHWAQTGTNYGSGENPGADTANYDWMWGPGASEGYWTPGSFNDGQYTEAQYVAPPSDPDPLGRLDFRMGNYGGENPSGNDGSGFYDRGSGLAVTDRGAIDRGTLAELNDIMAGKSIEQQVRDIYNSQSGIVGGHAGLRYAMNHGLFPAEVAAQLEPWVAAQEKAEADSRGFSSAVNDFYQTGKNHISGIVDSWKEDPERALLGINTPLESEVWGELLGEDYESNMNMFGGATEDTFERTAAEGYDPRFFAAGQNAIEGIIGGMAGSYLGGTAFGQTPTGQTAIAAGRSGVGAMNQGQDPWKNMLWSGLTALAQMASAPSGSPAPGAGIERMQVADAGTGMLDAVEPLMPPAVPDAPFAPVMPPAIGPESSISPMMPPAVRDPGIPSSTSFQAPDVGMLSSLAMPAAEPEVSDPTVDPITEPTAEPEAPTDYTKYVKLAKAVSDLFGMGEGDAPAGAPTQEDAEDDAHYGEELAQYLDLDPKAMADAGLEPGSQEYYEYIMTQADAVIAQVLEGMDVDSADFAQQLRAKTVEEQQALQRALYVRGQMGQLMGSGTYTDPATGIKEEVIGEGLFNPGTAAYQRGLARNVDTLAGMGGQQGLDYLNQLLGRDVDMFGMQGQADAKLELAKRTEQEDEIRRRGMFAGY